MHLPASRAFKLTQTDKQKTHLDNTAKERKKRRNKREQKGKEKGEGKGKGETFFFLFLNSDDFFHQ